MPLAGRGVLHVGERRIEVRVESGRLRHLPQGDEPLVDLLVPGTLLVSVIDPAEFARLIPGYDDLKRFLRLRIRSVTVKQDRWRISGTWTPPGGREPLAFDHDGTNPLGTELARTVLRIAMGKNPIRIVTEEGPVSLALTASVPEAGDVLLTLAGQAALYTPSPLTLDFDGLHLRLTGDRWSWSAPGSVAFDRDAKDRITAAIRAAATRLGLATALNPKAGSAGLPVEVVSLTPAVTFRNGSVETGLTGMAQLTVGPLDPPIKEEVVFTFDREGLRVDLERLLADLRERLKKEAQEQLRPVGRAVANELERWLDESLRGLTAQQFNEPKTGVVFLPGLGLLESRFRRNPLKLGPLLLRVNRVVSCKYYVFQPSDDGSVVIRFAPIPPVPVPLEDEVQFRQRVREYTQRLDQVEKRLDEFALEFDAEFLLPSGAGVEVTIVNLETGNPSRYGAFCLTSKGLSMRPGTTVRLLGPTAAWLRQLARGPSGDALAGVAAISESLPVAVRTSLEGVPADGNLSALNTNTFGLRADCEVTPDSLPRLASAAGQ